MNYIDPTGLEEEAPETLLGALWQIAKEQYRFPVNSGILTSVFGMRPDPKGGAGNSIHTGIDIAVPVGTETVSPQTGNVEQVVSEHKTYGNAVVIKNEDGKYSLLAHLDSIDVNAGDKIYKGERVGATGNTGFSTGPHLHFGMYNENTKIPNLENDEHFGRKDAIDPLSLPGLHRLPSRISISPNVGKFLGDFFNRE